MSLSDQADIYENFFKWFYQFYVQAIRYDFDARNI